MRRLLPIALLLAPFAASAETGLEGLGATVVRSGSGPRLYLVKQRVRVGGGGRFMLVDGPPLATCDGKRLLARRSEKEPWSPVSVDPWLLFPELLGEEWFKARYRPAKDGGFEPVREEERKLVERVSIARGAEGRPKRVTVHFAGGGCERREYGEWRPISFPILPAGEVAAEAEGVAWPPEVAWGSALETRLEELAKKLGKLEDLSGRYVREKRTLLLAHPSIAKGRFLFVPGRLIWIDEEPRESRVLLTREKMEIYDPGSKRLERFLFGKSEIGKYVFLGFGDSLAEGLRRMHPVAFEDGAGRVELTLRPVGGPLARHVKRLSLVLDPERGLLTEMGYEDPTGDSVVTRFTDVRRNTGVKAEDVAIRPAEGTKIVTNEGELPWR